MLRNRKAHMNPLCLGIQGAVIVSGIYFTYLLMSAAFPTMYFFIFAIILFASQFIHLMFGIKNPIGYVLMLIITFSALIMMKAIYSFPDSGVTDFLLANALFIIPIFVALDITRNIFD
ncbi:MAG: hypothetical protein ABIG20_02980 [archaeon]